MHQMAYRKAIAVHVLGYNSSILAHMQPQPRKGRSLITEHSLGVLIVRICRILFELYLMKKKNKMKILAFHFLDCEEKSWDSGGAFDIRIAKVFHLQEFCISSLRLSWSCSHTLSTGCLLKPAQSLLKRYYHTSC